MEDFKSARFSVRPLGGGRFHLSDLEFDDEVDSDFLDLLHLVLVRERGWGPLTMRFFEWGWQCGGEGLLNPIIFFGPLPWS